MSPSTAEREDQPKGPGASLPRTPWRRRPGRVDRCLARRCPWCTGWIGRSSACRARWPSSASCPSCTRRTAGPAPLPSWRGACWSAFPSHGDPCACSGEPPCPRARSGRLTLRLPALQRPWPTAAASGSSADAARRSCCDPQRLCMDWPITPTGVDREWMQ